MVLQKDCRYFAAIHPRHFEIENNQIHWLLRRQFDPSGAALSHEDCVSVLLQNCPLNFQRFAVVINAQNGCHGDSGSSLTLLNDEHMALVAAIALDSVFVTRRKFF